MPFNTSMPVHVLSTRRSSRRPASTRRSPRRRSRRSAPRPRSCRRRTAVRPTTASARRSTAGCSSSSSPPAARSTATRATAATARPPRCSSTRARPSTSCPWWQKMVKDGLAANTGRDTKAAQAAFKSGQVAVTLESTGQLGGFRTPRQGRRLRPGSGQLPQGQQAGAAARSSAAHRCGSTGSGHEDAQKEAAWQFVKFLAEPKSQADLAHRHRLLPDLQERAQRARRRGVAQEQFPQFDVAVKQLENTKVTKATAGLPARRHAPGPQGLRGRPGGCAQRRRPPAVDDQGAARASRPRSTVQRAR